VRAAGSLKRNLRCYSIIDSPKVGEVKCFELRFFGLATTPPCGLPLSYLACWPWQFRVPPEIPGQSNLAPGFVAGLID
jgi:hypothetical protein